MSTVKLLRPIHTRALNSACVSAVRFTLTVKAAVLELKPLNLATLNLTAAFTRALTLLPGTVKRPRRLLSELVKRSGLQQPAMDAMENAIAMKSGQWPEVQYLFSVSCGVGVANFVAGRL